MTNSQIAAVIAAVVVVAIAVAWYAFRRRRTRRLRSQFGSEYEYAVRRLGSREKAEADLVKRRQRVGKLHIVSLSEESREAFAGRWRGAQSRFVDDPPGAVHEADRLVSEVLAERGYPVSDFESQAAYLSVDHAGVVRNYRAAHAIAERVDRGEASTEELREAMVHYRDLFEELLEAHPVGSREVRG